MRAWVSPPKTTRSPPATVASITMPQEKASRSPRKENWRGMKPSWARIAPRRGKALKLVLTARKRIRAVDGLEGDEERCGVAEDRGGDHRDDGLAPLLGRPDAEAVGDDRDPDEEHAEQDRHRQHRVGGVLRFGRLEGGDAVGDRLDAGEGHRAACECPEDEEDAEGLVRRQGYQVLGQVRRCGLAGGDLDGPDPDHQQGQADEEVGRAREQEAGLAQAPQVRHRDEGDRRDRDLDPEVVEGRDDGVDLGHGRGRRDGDRHDVVDEERGGCDETEDLAEVLLGHHVRPAAGWIGPADLPVRDRHDREQDRDRDRHLERDEERPGPGQDQDAQDLLGRVRGRRDGVGAEDRQGELLRQPLVGLFLVRQASPEQEAPHRPPCPPARPWVPRRRPSP